MSRSHARRTAAVIALAALATLAAPAAAGAGVLASGYLLSSNAVRFGCRILNAGSKAVKITSAKVVLDTGTPFADFNGCAGTTLAPGASCTVSGPANHMAGIATVEGTTKGLRGTCMLFAAGNALLAATEMR